MVGYQTEYSSMSFALFWLGEYANILLMCALNAILFWGGWLPPLNVDWIPWFDIPGIFWLFGKMLFFFVVVKDPAADLRAAGVDGGVVVFFRKQEDSYEAVVKNEQHTDDLAEHQHKQPDCHSEQFVCVLEKRRSHCT